jgi:hypothetical protein
MSSVFPGKRGAGPVRSRRDKGGNHLKPRVLGLAHCLAVCGARIEGQDGVEDRDMDGKVREYPGLGPHEKVDQRLDRLHQNLLHGRCRRRGGRLGAPRKSHRGYDRQDNCCKRSPPRHFVKDGRQKGSKWPPARRGFESKRFISIFSSLIFGNDFAFTKA